MPIGLENANGSGGEDKLVPKPEPLSLAASSGSNYTPDEPVFTVCRGLLEEFFRNSHFTDKPLLPHS